jgi:hypothetical protein
MVGAFGPALKAGSPVTGSVTIFIRCGRFLRGVKHNSSILDILRPEDLPGRMSSRRRSGPGRTTCPLVDTLVCMVGRTYLCARSLANETTFTLAGFPDGHMRLSDCFSAVVLLQTDRLIGINHPFWLILFLHYPQCVAWMLSGCSSLQAPPIPLGWSGTMSL